MIHDPRRKLRSQVVLQVDMGHYKVFLLDRVQSWIANCQDMEIQSSQIDSVLQKEAVDNMWNAT